MSADKVSIIIPCYNAANTIRKTIESLKNQTYKNIEIIIVDDSSIDGSQDICRNIAKEMNNVQLIFHEQNRGQLAAWKDGLKTVNGQWVLLLDADDILKQDAIERLMKIADNFSPDIVFGNYETIGFNNEIIVHKAQLSEKMYSREEFAKLIFDKIPLSLVSCVGSKLYNTDFLQNRKIKTADDMIANADLGFAVDAIRSCDSIFYVNYAGYVYIQRENSDTYSYKENKYELFTRARRELKSYFTSCGCYDEKKLQLALMQSALVVQALLQEVKYKKGFLHFKQELLKIADHERTKETYNIILQSNKYLKNKILMHFVIKKRAMLLYIIFFIKEEIHGQ